MTELRWSWLVKSDSQVPIQEARLLIQSMIEVIPVKAQAGVIDLVPA